MLVTSTLIEAPAAEPVDVALAMLAVRIDDDPALRPQFEAALVAAREQCEREIGRALITQTRRLQLRDWPACAGGRIPLDFPPVQRVLAVEYWSATGWQAVPEAVYDLVFFDDLSHAVLLRPGQHWPGLADSHGPRVRVDFVAGFGDGPDDVPKPLQQWITAMAGFDVQSPTHTEQPPHDFLNRKLDAWRTRV